MSYPWVPSELPLLENLTALLCLPGVPFIGIAFPGKCVINGDPFGGVYFPAFLVLEAGIIVSTIFRLVSIYRVSPAVGPPSVRRKYFCSSNEAFITWLVLWAYCFICLAIALLTRGMVSGRYFVELSIFAFSSYAILVDLLFTSRVLGKSKILRKSVVLPFAFSILAFKLSGVISPYANKIVSSFGPRSLHDDEKMINCIQRSSPLSKDKMLVCRELFNSNTFERNERPRKYPSRYAHEEDYYKDLELFLATR